jgi:hypothetical protein
MAVCEVTARIATVQLRGYRIMNSDQIGLSTAGAVA